MMPNAKKNANPIGSHELDSIMGTMALPAVDLAAPSGRIALTMKIVSRPPGVRKRYEAGHDASHLRRRDGSLDRRHPGDPSARAAALRNDLAMVFLRISTEPPATS